MNIHLFILFTFNSHILVELHLHEFQGGLCEIIEHFTPFNGTMYTFWL
jgi:hypothetical protein